MKLSHPGLVFWKFLNYWFNFIARDQSVRIFLFLPDSFLQDGTFPGIYPFLLGCQICWLVIVLECFKILFISLVSFVISRFISNFYYFACSFKKEQALNFIDLFVLFVSVSFIYILIFIFASFY